MSTIKSINKETQEFLDILDDIRDLILTRKIDRILLYLHDTDPDNNIIIRSSLTKTDTIGILHLIIHNIITDGK